MFKVGDKVICVDDKLKYPKRIIEGKLRCGNIYTIRKYFKGDDYGKPGVYLKEIILKTKPKTKLEYGFHAIRFRKLWDEEKFQTLNKEKILETV